MYPLRNPLCCLGVIIVTLLVGPGRAAAQPPPPPDVPPNQPQNQDVQVLQSGPIHEAFAQPTANQPVPGAIEPKQPPQPIPEVPPEEKPAGKDVIWIPGYWWWDLQKNDFIWVSGIWRAPPPDRKWVPGYWTQAEGGWQWVSGFWASDNQTAVQYLSPPPESVDAGPNTPAPGDNYSWVPGTWLYQDNGYAWQPGMWVVNYPGWIYTPPCYNWTPAGYVFVNGYWDYDMDGRGWLFAPVWFRRPLWEAANWFYTPGYVLGWPGLLSSLFFGPHHHHYYFGDYYGANFWDRGFRPWGSYASHFNDPVFNHYRWVNRNNPNWAAGLRRDAAARIHSGNAPGVTATPLDRLGGSVAHSHVAEAQREQYRIAAEHLRQGSVARHELEHGVHAPAGIREPSGIREPGGVREPAGVPRNEPARSAGRVIHENRLPAEISHGHANLTRTVRPPAPPARPARPNVSEPVHTHINAPAHPNVASPAHSPPPARPHVEPNRPAPHPEPSHPAPHPGPPADGHRDGKHP